MHDPKPAARPADLDYGSLRAMFIDCTLKRSPGSSHTELLLGGVKQLLEANGVAVDSIRAIDHRIATGMSRERFGTPSLRELVR